MELVRGHGEMERLAQELAASIVSSPEGATVVTFSGDLGAGKTTLVQAIAKELGVTEQVTSPTFIIERVYALPQNTRGFSRLVHIDAYRLEGAHELEHLGWKELLADPGNLILIEWPERVAECIPSGAKRVTLEYVDDATRQVNYG